VRTSGQTCLLFLWTKERTTFEVVPQVVAESSESSVVFASSFCCFLWGIRLLLVSLAAALELGHHQRVLLCSVEAESLFSFLVVGEFLPDFVKFGLEVSKYFLSVNVVVVVVVLIGEFPNALN